MENANSIGTPMSPTTMLNEDSNGKSVDETMYRGMIGSLLYLTASRPDIMFSVFKCARFQLAPKEFHLTNVKRIIRYFIGTSELGLCYAHSNNFALRGFLDADFVGDKIDRKSTSGTCQLLRNALVSWHSKKQNCIALSTTECHMFVNKFCAHSRAKHIEIKHHFIRDYVAKGDIVLELISTESQLADIFTKSLLEERFFVYYGKSLV
ncbi:secreted RxLR effector protein 161-like [Nicotiana tabacum]|uniref:Secreted RxLR effector protein 161-like n=1 Tax=Nicotiana tabacum TaxID=4097 RepID=A0AC58SU14_TOBAC